VKERKRRVGEENGAGPSNRWTPSPSPSGSERASDDSEDDRRKESSESGEEEPSAGKWRQRSRSPGDRKKKATKRGMKNKRRVEKIQFHCLCTVTIKSNFIVSLSKKSDVIIKIIFRTKIIAVY